MDARSLRSAASLIGLISLTSVELLAQSSWVRTTSMPTARFWFTACAVEGKIYAIGGTRSISAPYLSTVEDYDPATDTWIRRANMPTARDGHVATVVDGKIYVIGGEPSAQASIPTVEAYDPATDAWTQKANIPTQRDGAVAAVVYGRLYVIGGATGDLHNAPVTKVEEYDPLTDTWTAKAPMRTARIFPSAAVMGGKIWVIGGAIWPTTFFSTVEMYDPVADTWTAQPPLAATRYGLCSDAVNGKIYSIGGCQVGYPGAGLATVEEYDPAPTVSLLRSGSTLKVSWNGILESSDTVDGPEWQALNPPKWPYSVSLQAAPMKFYRAREP